MNNRKQFYFTLVLITIGSLLIIEVLARMVHLIVVG
ncbi:hypothetical protein SRABI13_00572 [Erwinia aphidicola]|jgi:hypothetical protein|nr:hypothetical protein [Erwinia aphidicola]CAH0152637.1 hypothetical protein SRABI13_00572 [Erwinia aphidicola]